MMENQHPIDLLGPPLYIRLTFGFIMIPQVSRHVKASNFDDGFLSLLEPLFFPFSSQLRFFFQIEESKQVSSI